MERGDTGLNASVTEAGSRISGAAHRKLGAMYDTSMDATSWSVGGGGWFTLALINAGLAEQKNRSRLNWFLLSLLLGPLATLLIVVMHPPV